jgi:hypothetical protein
MTVSCAWEGCPASFAGGIPPGWVWIGLDDARPLCPAHRRALAEGDATWRAELADRHAKALKAIAAGRGPRTVLRHVVSYSVGLDSHARLPALLDLMEGMPAGVFWQVLTNQWNICDDTWRHVPALLELMRRHRAAAPARLNPSFPTEFAVFRGSSRARARGISWTTDRAVALRFAQGHRRIPVPEPVIAAARIRRAGVFLFIRGRREHEVLLDPAALIGLRVARL